MEDDGNCNDIFSEIVDKANEYLLEDLDEKAHDAIEKAIMDILNKYNNSTYNHSVNKGGPIFINAASHGSNGSNGFNANGYIDSETPRPGRMISPELIEQVLRGKRPASPSLVDPHEIKSSDSDASNTNASDSEVKTNDIVETAAISPTNQKDDEQKGEKKRSLFSRFRQNKSGEKEEKKPRMDRLIEKEDAVNAKLNKAMYAFLLNTPGVAQVSMGRNLRQTVVVNNDQKPIPVILVTDLNRSKSRETKKKERQQKLNQNQVKPEEVKKEEEDLKKEQEQPKDQPNVKKEEDVLELVDTPTTVEDQAEEKDDSWSSTDEE